MKCETHSGDHCLHFGVFQIIYLGGGQDILAVVCSKLFKRLKRVFKEFEQGLERVCAKRLKRS